MRGLGRRTFLVGGATAATGLFAACSDTSTRSTGVVTAAPTERSMPRTDADIATLAAGIEILLAGAYRSLRDRLDGGAFGRVSPGMDEYVRVAMAHHEEHRRLWQDVLHKTGRPPVTLANAQLAPAVERQLAAVSDLDNAAQLALGLESVAADTYLRSMTEAAGVETARSAARIGIVEQQHQAFLRLALGQYPAPDSLMRPEKAVTP